MRTTMTGIGANRHSQACPHCGTAAKLPEWSEAVAEKETVCIWRCMGCGNEFETTDKVVVQGPTIFELVEEFLPNLVVA
jgi:Zn ribbon nucleic-acid-binding protein